MFRAAWSGRICAESSAHEVEGKNTDDDVVPLQNQAARYVAMVSMETKNTFPATRCRRPSLRTTRQHPQKGKNDGGAQLRGQDAGPRNGMQQ